MAMDWWHWIAIGLILAGLELATPGGFFIIFFGLGGLLVGLLGLFGLAGPLWLQWLLFSFFSILALLLFRNPLLRWLGARARPGPDVDSLVGEIAIPLEDIVPDGVGRVELRGTTWSARNRGRSVLGRGQRCTVAAVEGLLLSLEPEGDR
jgi:membrane protein implicated in regulation of membrane protease activity